MKKIFLGLIAIALTSGVAFAANDGGGKKKNKKKAKTECKVQNCDPKNCDPKNCDPKNCDPRNCNPKCIEMPTASAQTKCVPASCPGN
jgi:hypothetical protein